MKKISIIVYLLVIMGLLGCTAAPSQEPEVTPTENQETEAVLEVTEPTQETLLDSYTATSDQLKENAEVVVATMGDRNLTVGELQLYYSNAIYTFYSQNAYYLAAMNLDLSQPLDQQLYPGEENVTWEQFFLDSALQSWQNYTAAEILSQRDNFILPEELQGKIETMPQQLESVALTYGYEDTRTYLEEQMAPGVTEEMYYEFNRIYVVSNEYVNNFYTAQFPDIEQIDQYYADNEESMLASGITPDVGLLSSVRHILIKPKGGTVDENGAITYSEGEWAEALTQAESILQQWQAGDATDESFAELANTYSEDGGSNTKGGLYTQVSVNSNYVPEFENWAIDVNRKPGDTEIVRTTYGYHIMYFVSGESYYERVVGEQLLAQQIKQLLADIKEELPIQINYQAVLLRDGAILK